jgi:hypothetical protein
MDSIESFFAECKIQIFLTGAEIYYIKIIFLLETSGRFASRLE